jgi:hypothetical protein
VPVGGNTKTLLGESAGQFTATDASIPSVNPSRWNCALAHSLSLRLNSRRRVSRPKNPATGERAALLGWGGFSQRSPTDIAEAGVAIFDPNGFFEILARKKVLRSEGSSAAFFLKKLLWPSSE